LREMADRLKDQIRSGIILLGAQGNGKALLLCAVTKDLEDRYPANRLIKEVAKYVEGTGGGRADMAQAGGTNLQGLNQAIENIYKMI
jgi:alanyl-tRNA synthetase